MLFSRPPLGKFFESIDDQDAVRVTFSAPRHCEVSRGNAMLEKNVRRFSAQAVGDEMASTADAGVDGRRCNNLHDFCSCARRWRRSLSPASRGKRGHCAQRNQEPARSSAGQPFSAKLSRACCGVALLLRGSGWQPVADIAAQARRPVDLEAEERTSEFNLNKISRRAGTNSLLIVGYAGIVNESSFSWIDDPAGLPSG